MKLALSLKPLGTSADKVAERLKEAGYFISRKLLYEAIENHKHRTKCVKLARLMSLQNDKVTKDILWNLFKAE